MARVVACEALCGPAAPAAVRQQPLSKVCMYLYMYLSMYVCMHVCMYVCMYDAAAALPCVHIRTYSCMNVFFIVYALLYASMYVCIPVCMYACNHCSSIDTATECRALPLLHTYIHTSNIYMYIHTCMAAGAVAS